MLVEIFSAEQQSFYVSINDIRHKLSYGTCLMCVRMHFSPDAQLMSCWYPPCSDVCMGSLALISGGKFAGRISFDTWTRDHTSPGAKHTYAIIHWQMYGMNTLKSIAMKKTVTHITVSKLFSQPCCLKREVKQVANQQEHQFSYGIQLKNYVQWWHFAVFCCG